MRERLLTLGLGVGALILFYALIFPKPHNPAPAQGLPLSTDAQPQGVVRFEDILRAIGRYIDANGT